MPTVLFSTPGLAIYTSVVTVIFGLVMGSFLNCLAWRSVRGESWTHGRSHCDYCDHVLSVRDLVPVVSWLSTGGRCRYCGKHISARNPVSEIICAIVYLLVVLRYDLSLETLEMLGLSSVLLVATLTDLDDYVIPNGCIASAVIIRALFIVGEWKIFGADPLPFLKMSLIGAAAIGVPLILLVLVMDRVLKRPSMGGGDIKLFIVAGLYFGWQRCLFLLIVACVLGILFAILFQAKATSSDDSSHEEQIRDKKDSEDVPSRAFPFGPSIAAAFIVTMIVGDQILAWYLSLVL